MDTIWTLHAVLFLPNFEARQAETINPSSELNF